MHRIPLCRARPGLRVEASRPRIAAHRHGLAVAAGVLCSACVATAGASRAQQPAQPAPPSAAPAAPASPAGAASAEGGATLVHPRPSPALTPEQVVGIQLDALQHNDSPTPDFGIETATLFASPGSRLATDPLPRFAEVGRSSVFRPMINHRRVERGPMRVDGDRARQRVTVVTASGARVAYMFLLSRQHGGAYAGCWMTDGLVRLNETGPRTDGLRSA